MKIRQIMAMGGGGFSMEPDNPLLDRYFLAQTGRRRPAVCFVPTASGDADGYIVKFYAAFGKLPCTPTHLSLFRPPKDLAAVVSPQQGHEIVFVYDARFVDETLYARATLPFHEASWASGEARWLDLAQDRERLVPEGLRQFLPVS